MRGVYQRGNARRTRGDGVSGATGKGVFPFPTGYHRATMSTFFSFLPRLLFLALGCGMVVGAGRMEAEGRLEEARRRVRQGGFLAAVGSLLAAVGSAALPTNGGLVAALVLASGFAALLAGLSGKPRPTGWAALALLVAGVVVALLAVR